MAAAIALLPASPAAAAPSGDEYLPKVPKAAGKEVVANPEQGPGASVLEPTIRGASTDESSEPEAKPKKHEPKRKKKKKSTATIVPASSNDDDSSGGTLFNPIILLVVAGVIAAAVGMTLRRRHSDGPAGAEERKAGRNRGPHPTPDGEIVAGGDEAA